MLVLMPIAGQVASRVQRKYLIAGGMLLIAITMWHMTSLVPDASFGYFARARIYQMLGLPFLAAGADQSSLCAYQRRAQSRRHHRCVADRNRTRPTLTIPPCASDRTHLSVVGSLSGGCASDVETSGRGGNLGRRRSASGAWWAGVGGPRPSIDPRLYRCVP
jgi:hypothetical protein